MVLKNKLGLTDSIELAHEEERISKKRAIELFESGYLDTLPAGSFLALCKIHERLFSDIYDFAGKIRTALAQVQTAFHAQLDALSEFRFINLESEMDVLADMLAGDGLLVRDQQAGEDSFDALFAQEGR